MTSVETPLATRRPIMKPNGVPPDRTPAATSVPEASELFEAVIGRLEAGCRLPMLVIELPPTRFHCTPSSRPAVRDNSMKRTSSITCCGDITMTVLMISGPNWRAMVTALSSVAASETRPDSMIRPLTLDARSAEPGKLRASSLVSRVRS